MSDLTESMLAKPTSLAGTQRKGEVLPATRAIEITGTTVSAEIRAAAGTVNEGTGLTYLTEEGLNPDEWEAIAFRKIKYGEGLESVKFSYRRRLSERAVEMEDLIRLVKSTTSRSRHQRRKAGPLGFLVALGDMQYGKIDGDSWEGALTRAITYLEAARDRLYNLRRQGHEIGTVVIAFLGDHVEGFTSQGGAGTWRTPLTLNEQIRLTRRTMFHAVQIFAQTSARVVILAVPGNHGRVTTQNGSNTRYDDSHDTEALIAVSEACALAPGAFGHVEFYVPATDEITVTVDVAGCRIAAVHGDRWTKGKAMEWWAGQAFGKSPLTDADVLLSGHYHHLIIEEDGTRMHVQVPALEAESTWWRHKKGTPGNPGVVTALVGGGRLRALEVIR